MESPQISDAGPWSFPAVLSGTNVVLLLVAWLAFYLVKSLYNISPLHPLSSIPGPRLAAATYLPEFYYDVIKFGRYTHQIKAMHEKYGPLVRISPDEIHCADANFSDEIYATGSRKRDKPFHQVNGTVLAAAEFGTAGHDLHRARRAPVAKFFSKSKVAELEGEIKDHVQKLCDKLLKGSGKGPFEVKTALSCFTADVVSDYAFGHSLGFLEQEGWYPNFKDPTEAALQMCHVFRWFPALKNLDQLGKYFIDYLPADVALFIRTMHIDIPTQINKTREAMEAGLLQGKDRHTIFGEILFDDEMQSKEKGTKRLSCEGFAIIGAGTETTASTIAMITYHLLKNPELLVKLTAELRGAGLADDPKALPSLPTLEKLPYLSAVIKEGLRLSYGVSSRTARVAPDEELFYRGEWNKKPVEYVVPRGYAVGMSTVITHHDENIFPDSYSFMPERWLDEYNQLRKEPERGLMPFSKGSRACLAMNLALTEIHFAVVALALRVWPRMDLYQTTDGDVAYDHDMFIPMPKAGSNGIRVVVS